ncbi:MAG: oxalurate catabolism protein HpxZ [Hyphomonadaceae bacterium]
MIVNAPGPHAELTAAFEGYEAALMANDIEKLDGFFWRSAFTVRYGQGENLYGYEAIAAFRRARPGGAPPRTLTRTEIVTFGDDFGFAHTEYRRANSEAVGRQSQTWARFPEGWRVVAAHVSLMTP